MTTTLTSPAAITTVLAVGQGPAGPVGPSGPSDHTLLTSIGVNTHAQIDVALARLAGTSGNNTGDETGPRLAALNHAATAKPAIVDADEVTGGDSANGFGLIRTTWASVAAYLQAKTDLLYLALLPTIIKMGGTTNAFPMLKRNGTGVDVRLADDSGPANLNIGAVTIADVGSAITFGASTLTLQRSSGQNLGVGAGGNSAVTIGSNGISLANSGPIAFTASTSAIASLDLFLWRDAANVLAQRNGANAQGQRWYNTWTSASIGEWVEGQWSGNLWTLQAAANGTGTIRGISFKGGATGNANLTLDDGAGARLVWTAVSGVSMDGNGTKFYGSTRWPTVTKTANFTSTVAEESILVDATAGNVVITLEAVGAGNVGRIKRIKKIDASANTVTIDGNASETIDGSLTIVLSTQWAARGIQVNAGGTAWNVIATV